jgi:hypothetical protein
MKLRVRVRVGWGVGCCRRRVLRVWHAGAGGQGALEGGRGRIEEGGVARWRLCKYQCNIYMLELF